MSHPDMWKGTIVRDLATLEGKLGARTTAIRWAGPTATATASCARFADAIRDRLKQYPTMGKIDEIGTQDEAIYLYYSSRRFSGWTFRRRRLRPACSAATSTCPAAAWKRPSRTLVLQPSGEFKSEQELGEVVDRRRKADIPPAFATWSISSAVTKIRRA